MNETKNTRIYLDASSNVLGATQLEGWGAIFSGAYVAAVELPLVPGTKVAGLSLAAVSELSGDQVEAELFA